MPREAASCLVAPGWYSRGWFRGASAHALDWFLETGIWLLFVVLLVPAIALGFVIGRSEKQKTKTVVQTPAMAAKSLITAARRRSRRTISPQTASDDWITNGGSTLEPALLVARRDQRLERLAAEGRVADASAQVGHRREVLRREPAARVPGRDLRADGPGRRLRRQRRHAARSSGSTRRTSTRRSPSSAAAGRAAASRSATAGSTSASSTGSSSRSTSRPGRSRGQTQVARWQDGYSITAAPLYVDGMVDHRPLRRRVRDPRPRHRLRRDDRQAALAVLHDPGPGRDRPRHVAADRRRVEAGGAPVWQTPSVDPKLGLLYFTTGNAGPGQQRQPARRQEPLRRVDGRARRARPGKLQVGVPDGPPRHLGLRRAEPDDPLRREGQRQGRARHRRGREDRLGLPPEPRDGQAAVPDAGEARAAGRESEDVADAADPAVRAGRAARAVATRSTSRCVQGREAARRSGARRSRRSAPRRCTRPTGRR